MGCFPYTCIYCGGADVISPPETDDYDKYDPGGWERACVIIPGSLIWTSRKKKKQMPTLEPTYTGSYEGYGYIHGPGGVLFVLDDYDMEPYDMAEEGADFAYSCTVACASCWAAHHSAKPLRPISDRTPYIRAFIKAYAEEEYGRYSDSDSDSDSDEEDTYAGPKSLADYAAYSHGLEFAETGDGPHPIRTEWFRKMVFRATAADLDALEAIKNGDGLTDCMVHCIQDHMLQQATKIWKGGHPYVSAAIPAWFRAHGWDVPAGWA